MLRTTKDDEGCDIECPMCGRHCVVGRCFCCGWGPRQCQGCGAPAKDVFVLEVEKTIDWVFLCEYCTEQSFEQQRDDAQTP